VSVKPIRLFGDPVLRTEAEPVRDFDAELRKLVKDLTDTMMDAPGAGLAAPQIGVGLRVFAYAVGSERGYLVNPVLEFPDEEEQEGEEGCLSFPGIYYDVKRRLNTVASGFTDRGDPVQVVGTGWVASAGALISTNWVASSGKRGRRPGATSSCRRDPGNTELTSGQVLKRWGSTSRAPDHSRS